MEGPLKPAGPETDSPLPQPKGPQRRSAHLMCGARFWGVIAAGGCLYFAYYAYSALRDGDYSLSHDGWALLTYSVWIVLALGLISEVRCWRERIFFGLVLLNLTLGFVLASWSSVPMNTVRDSRRIEMGIWLLAAIASAWTALAVKQVAAEPQEPKPDAAGTQP